MDRMVALQAIRGDAALARTTAIIPALDEAEHIAEVIAALLPDDGRGAVGEVIVADGGSGDGTVEIVRRLGERDPRIRLIHNPARRQGAGVNAAVAAADPASDIVLRLDAHAGYPRDFAARAVAALGRSGADSVVVRLDTVARPGAGSAFQRAVAAAFNSRLGSGGAVHRVGGASGFVDHGHHAAFRRAAFAAVGGYDESFAANEDAELDARLRAAGGRIWFEGDLAVAYYPRRTPGALARQYGRYGRARARTFRTHGERLALRQIAPPVLAAGLAASLLAAAAVSGWFLAGPLLYLAALAAVGVGFARRGRDPALLMVPVALAIGHVSWGGGFIVGLLADPLIAARSGSAKNGGLLADACEGRIRRMRPEAVAQKSRS